MRWVKKLFGWSADYQDNDPSVNDEPSLFTEAGDAPVPTRYREVDFLRELCLEADQWVGVHEEAENKGRIVERFQKAVDGKASGEPWCAAFVQFCIKEVARRSGATAVVNSSELCMDVWQGTAGVHRYASPKAGYLVIWRFADTRAGHMGIVRRVIDEFTIETIEGNTGPSNKEIEREADGVYRKTRSTKPYGNMKLVGYICPFNPTSVERPEVPRG